MTEDKSLGSRIAGFNGVCKYPRNRIASAVDLNDADAEQGKHNLQEIDQSQQFNSRMISKAAFLSLRGHPTLESGRSSLVPSREKLPHTHKAGPFGCLMTGRTLMTLFSVSNRRYLFLLIQRYYETCNTKKRATEERILLEVWIYSSFRAKPLRLSETPLHSHTE